MNPSGLFELLSGQNLLYMYVCLLIHKTGICTDSFLRTYFDFQGLATEP